MATSGATVVSLPGADQLLQPTAASDSDCKSHGM